MVANKKKKISELFNFLPKSKIKAGEGLENGKYPFYTCSNELTKYYDEYTFEPNKLIFGTGGSASLHYASEPFATSTDCYVIEAKELNVDVKYVYYYLKNNFQILEDGFKGAGLKHISKDYLSNIMIEYPDIEEQQRIVKILDKADEIRTKKKLANEKLDEFLKSTFIDMFGDPVTNPKGFAIKNLKDFYFDDKAVKCGPFGSALKKSEYVQKGIPVWNMDNITIKSEFIPKPNLYITEQKFNELQSYTAINNDIIISRAGTVGKMCVLEGLNSATIISTNLIRLRLNKSKLSPIWFIKLLEYNGNKVCRLKRGCDGAFTHMNTGILDNIYFPYPEIDSQNLYVEIYKRVKAQKEKNQKVIEQMDNLFNSLMQQAFNGEM